MIRFITLLSIGVLIQIQALTIGDVDQILKTTHPSFLALQEERASGIAQINSQYASSAPVLSGFIADAHPDDAQNETEYSVGIGKSFSLFGTRDKQAQIAKMQLEAQIIAKEQALLTLRNDVMYQYHAYCINQSAGALYAQYVADFDTLYEKKKRAYALGEISKKELLQLEMEKKQLQIQNTAKINEIQNSKVALLASLQRQEETIECKALSPILEHIDTQTALFSLSAKSYELEIEAAKQSASVADRKFDTVDLSVGYDREVDLKRYGLGIAVPLSFASPANEQQKISALHAQKVKKLEKSQMLLEKEKQYQILSNALLADAQAVSSLASSVATYENELLTLMEKSYLLGESSITEYLLSKQQYRTLQESLHNTKLRYYKTLFDLLSAAEMKDNL